MFVISQSARHSTLKMNVHIFAEGRDRGEEGEMEEVRKEGEKKGEREESKKSFWNFLLFYTFLKVKNKLNCNEIRLS